MNITRKIRPGDLVEVKAPEEILETLDADGTLDRLPFMPEMIDCCGRRFRIAKRVVKTCASGPNLSTMRTFQRNDVFVLDTPRCSGIDHDGCQKACTIFWREAWLRRVGDGPQHFRSTAEARGRLRARLKTTIDPDTYFCQASELLRATEALSRWGRFGKCIEEVRSGNCGVLEMTQRIGTWVFWRIRRRFLGEYARGHQRSTPEESLRLQAGELVEIRPMKQIVETVNERARNRGLYFSPDMSLLCGRRRRVERRLEKIIADGTGKMRRLHNTVYLEGSPCGCSHVAFGGCSRCEFSYWREIWLQRASSSNGNH